MLFKNTRLPDMLRCMLRLLKWFVKASAYLSKDHLGILPASDVYRVLKRRVVNHRADQVRPCARNVIATSRSFCRPRSIGAFRLAGRVSINGIVRGLLHVHNVYARRVRMRRRAIRFFLYRRTNAGCLFKRFVRCNNRAILRVCHDCVEINSGLRVGNYRQRAIVHACHNRVNRTQCTVSNAFRQDDCHLHRRVNANSYVANYRHCQEECGVQRLHGERQCRYRSSRAGSSSESGYQGGQTAGGRLGREPLSLRRIRLRFLSRVFGQGNIYLGLRAILRRLCTLMRSYHAHQRVLHRVVILRALGQVGTTRLRLSFFVGRVRVHGILGFGNEFLEGRMRVLRIDRRACLSNCSVFRRSI